MLDVKQEIERFKQGLRSEGRSEGKAEAIIMFLEGRGIAIGQEARQRILHCTDQALLNIWLHRAVVAQSAEDVLRPTG